MQNRFPLLVAAFVVAGSAAADPIADFQQHCVRPLAEQRCVLADADAAGLRERKPKMAPAPGAMAFRLADQAQMLFSGLEPHRCHVYAPRMTAEPVLHSPSAAVAVRAAPAPNGRGFLLTAETAAELAAPMAR